MKEFSYSIFLSLIQRLSCKQVQELIIKWQDELTKLSIIDANQIFKFIEGKFAIVERWQNESGMIDILTYKLIAKDRIPRLSSATFEEIDNLNKMHPTLHIEIIHHMEENERINFLNNFNSKLDSIIIQDLILAMNPSNQKKMILKYKDRIINTDYKLLLTFIATLNEDVQRYFLTTIKDSVINMNTDKIIPLILSIHEGNIEFFFKEYHSIIDTFQDKDFIKFLSMLAGKSLILFNKEFKNKINSIPADLLMYKLGLSIDDTEQIYNIWKENPNKLVELSDTYFNLVISRLDDISRLNSLTDFKSRYNKMDINDLLNLFEFDSDEIKARLFLEYKNKFDTLDTRTFIEYVTENVESSELRNKIFLLYKDKICSLNDEDFIFFIKSYSERNLKYSYYRNEKQKNKEELSNYIVTNFKERLQNINTDYLPILFSDSDASLQLKYIDVLKDSIEQLILDRTYIEKLLRAVWGSSKAEILKAFKEQFQTLTGFEWYKLLNVLTENDFIVIEDLLITCKIDTLDFFNKALILSNNRARKLFEYFQKNIQSKLFNQYNELCKNNKVDELLNRYEQLMTNVVDSEATDILTDYNCSELLILLRVLLANHIINDKDDYYQMFKEYYMNSLLKDLEKENTDNVNIIKDSIFYRLVKGSITPASLISLNTLKGLIFFNKVIVKADTEDIGIYKPDELEPFVQNMTEEQVIKINNKLFKYVCERLEEVSKYDYPSRSSIRDLALRIYLTFGYTNSLKVLSNDISFTTLEYILNNIDIHRIKLNNVGEPIINKKLNDFMFGSNLNDANTNINRLLNNTVDDFQKYFAQIYNGWQTIYAELNGNVSLSRILKWFEDNKVLLNPDEYKLAPYLNELGGNDSVIQKARSLYADMRKRKYSTIPKVSGNLNDEYTYEMLDLDDPLGLVVGYITRCCFLIDGQSRTSLFHSAQSKDGRIFVVRKNGELIAQSWVWRNGNLVCFDNIETRGNYDYEELLKAYQIASQSILETSAKDEDSKEQIKLVTFGGSYSKIAKPKEQVERKDLHLPRVEERIYTDAKYEQYILATNGDTELYYGDVKVQYNDNRKEPIRYANLALLERDDKSVVIKRIRSINFIKTGNLKTINFEEYAYAAITDDWYILVDNDGQVECLLLDNDKRAKTEIFDEIDGLEKIFTEFGVYANSKEVKGQILSFLKGCDL